MRNVFPIWSLALVALVLASAWAVPSAWVAVTRQPDLGPGSTVSVVVPAAWRDDGALALAVGDLSAYLRSTYGAQARLVGDSDAGDLPPFAMLVGDESNTRLRALVQSGELALPKLATEGYIIRSVEHQARPLLVVGAGDVRGAAYGLFRLVELSRLDRAGLRQPWEVAGEPAMALRAVGDPLEPTYPTPEQALRWGFNAIFVEAWTGLALYDRYDPAIFGAGRFAAERAWVEASRQRTRERIAQARRLHLQILSWGDVPSFPRQALDLYGQEVGPGRFCLERPRTRQMLAASLDEVLAEFAIDYVMVRTGENYALGPLVGNLPGDPACGAAEEGTPALAALIYDRVVRQYGRTYIQRAWDLGAEGMHANPTAATVLAGFPTQRFLLSYKHTRTDFWRYNAVNPNLGAGPFAQMVEFQAAREYEGKGAFPNYLGEVFAWGGQEVGQRGGLAYAEGRGVRAVWVWAKGGGWGGPQLQRDLWVDANVYALRRLAWNPAAAPADLAREWATLTFGAEAAPALTRLLLKSDDAILYALYTGPAARQRGDWAPNNVWVRDDVIRGGDWLAELYRRSRGEREFAAALAEKELAVKLVDSMVADYRQAQPSIKDQRLAVEALNTLLYERALVRVLARYFGGMFYYFHWLDSDRSDELARQRALAYLGEWQRAWTQYGQLAASLPGVATPYRDDGMVDTAAVALADLNGE